ncbi:MAG: beta-ketoacyl-[acyl-carrier-protein] synthase II, partial [Bacteroidales bacterium]|nr:beta-ketoacyl-[acyl-carrier-protein] synthase II [Bacteroidales bacterium]
IKGRKIDYFNAHGTGTRLNDDVEARVIQSLFGEESNQPVINSTKGMLGHSIGASGAIEAIVSVLSVKNSVIHANMTEDIIDNLNVPSKNVNKQIHLALSSSYGFGGHNAAILLKKI